MFRGNELQIPHAEKEYVNSLGDDGNTRLWGSSGVALPVDKPEDEVEKVNLCMYIYMYIYIYIYIPVDRPDDKVEKVYRFI
jgi:hypothetical protein